MTKISVYTLLTSFFADKKGTVELHLYTKIDGFDAHKKVMLDTESCSFSDFFQYREYGVTFFSAVKKNTIKVIATNYGGTDLL